MQQRTLAGPGPVKMPSEQGTSRQPLQAPASLARTLTQPGVPLPEPLLSQAGRHLHFDFSAVRVHTDPQAGESAREVSSRAYALRPHVVFAPGMFQPETVPGRARLLHELGHIKQQQPFSPDAPITLRASAAHERNATAQAHGLTTSVLGMPANVAALDSTSEPPDAVQLGREAIDNLRNGPKARGVLPNGGEYQVLPDGTLSVHYPRSKEGRVIIHDADDPADLIERPAAGSPASAAKAGARAAPPPLPGTLPTVELPETGERAVQRETKKVTAYNVDVTAIYEKKDVIVDERGVPIGLRRAKPIFVKAEENKEDGYLLWQETNKTRIGPAVRPDQPSAGPRVEKDVSRSRELRGTLEFRKGPEEYRGLEFNKLERATFDGKVSNDITKSKIIDHSTGNELESETHQESTGKTIAARGKSKPPPTIEVIANEPGAPVTKPAAADPAAKPNGTYVLDNKSEGEVEQSANKVQHQNILLASDRVLTIEQVENKRSAGILGKSLDNKGIEHQALDQTDTKEKRGAESSDATTTTTLFAIVEKKSKPGPGKAAADNDAIELVPVQVYKKKQRVINISFGRNKTTATETPKPGARGPINVKEEDTEKKADGGNLTLTSERARGLHKGEASFKLNGFDTTTSNKKKTSGPELATPSVRPPAGQIDIATIPLLQQPKVFAKGPVKASLDSAAVSVTDTGVHVSADGSASYGLHKLDPKKSQDTVLWGLFCTETTRDGMDLAGAYLKAQAQASAQRGGIGAQLKGAEASVTADASITVGFKSERGIKLRITPNTKRVNSPYLKQFIEAAGPVFELGVKAHALAGGEAKGNVGAQAGRDAGYGYNVGGSAFAGVRVGADVEGKVLLGSGVVNGGGSTFASIQGGLALSLGAGAAWKNNVAVVGGKLVAAGEGGLTVGLGLQGNLKAEMDLWKLTNVAVSILKAAGPLALAAGAAAGKKVYAFAEPAVSHAVGAVRQQSSQLVAGALDLYHLDDRARAQVAAHAYEQRDIEGRFALINSLITGVVSQADAQAVITILEDAKRRGDLEQLVERVGRRRLSFNLDGAANDRFYQLLAK